MNHTIKSVAKRGAPLEDLQEVNGLRKAKEAAFVLAYQCNRRGKKWPRYWVNGITY